MNVNQWGAVNQWMAELDTTKPLITLIGSPTVTITEGDAYTDAGATASDDVDSDITANIVTDNPVDENTVGTYAVTYNVSDSSGNAADEVTRTVIVEAEVINQPPVANAGPDQSVAAGVTVTLDGTGSTAVSPATITGYTWTQVEGDTVTLDLSNPARPTFISPTTNNIQTITHSLIITDSNGLNSVADTTNTFVAAEIPQVTTSTLAVTIKGIVDGEHTLKLWEETNDTKVFDNSVTFVNETANVSLSVASNTVITGRWLGDNPPKTGTGIYGITE